MKSTQSTQGLVSRFSPCFVVLATLLPAFAHAADELEMLSGARLQGKVVEESRDAITFESNGAELKLDTGFIQAISINGVRRELQASKARDAKPGAAQDDATTIGLAPEARSFLELTPELRKKLVALLDDAKREAREKIRVGLEQALAKRPKMAPEMAALMRSSSTQETWLKTIVDGAFTLGKRVPDLRTNVKAPPQIFEMKWAFACDSVRRMHDTEFGMEGAAFIDDYVSKALDTSVNVLPPEPAPGAKPPRKHLVHSITDASGIDQLGGN